MKNYDLQFENFCELSAEERIASFGGGFAYDVGRALRFIFITGPNGAGAGDAIGDACYTWYLNNK
jgi:hypothetical protein